MTLLEKEHKQKSLLEDILEEVKNNILEVEAAINTINKLKNTKSLLEDILEEVKNNILELKQQLIQ